MALAWIYIFRIRVSIFKSQTQARRQDSVTAGGGGGGGGHKQISEVHKNFISNPREWTKKQRASSQNFSSSGVKTKN